MAKGTKKKKEPRVIPGTSDYVVRENAARKQLGVAGLAARNKQVPTAARAALREMTGIDISRKGVSVDPMGVAMALPIGKVLKAAKALRTAGQAGNRLKFLAAEALEGRLAAKTFGKKIGSTFSYWDNAPRNLANVKRMTSEPIFPKLNKYDYEEIRSLNPLSARGAAKYSEISNVNRELAAGTKYLNKKLKGK